MKAIRKATTLRLAELRSRIMARLANRSFKMQPNAIDRMALQAIEKILGPAGEPDPDLEHSDL